MTAWHTNPKHPSIPPPQSPPDILRDLLDPTLSCLDIARTHNLDPAFVRAAVHSDQFRQAAESMRDADQARTDLLWPSLHAQTVHTLAGIAHQPTTTAAQRESARRACTTLLGGPARRAGSCSSPRNAGHPPALHHPNPLNEPPRAQSESNESSNHRHALPTPQTQPSQEHQPSPTSTPTFHNTPSPDTALIPLADFTGDPSLTLEDSLRLIAEIDDCRNTFRIEHGLPTTPTTHAPTTTPINAAQLHARAGAG